MQNRKTVFSLTALLGAAVVAPGLPVVLALAIAMAISVATGRVGSTGGLLFSPYILLQVLIATVLGFPSALAFGGCGALFAGHFLSSRGLWRWVLAGACSAMAYMLASILLGLGRSGLAVWVAPWLAILSADGRARDQSYDMASLVIVVGAILTAGGLAGLIYYFALKRSLIVWRTYSPLEAEREASEPLRHEEG